MDVRALVTKSLLSAAIAVGTIPIAAAHAWAGDNGGCGIGFTESSVTDLATYASNLYAAEGATYDQWFAFLTGVDKNQDNSVCWHPIGKLCPCGNNAINVIDDNANASNN